MKPSFRNETPPNPALPQMPSSELREQTVPADWRGYLDDLNIRLDSAFESIRGDLDFNPLILDSWKKPDNLGPIPLELADRARKTLKRYEELEPLLAAKSHELRENMQRLAHSGTATQVTHGANHVYGSDNSPKFIDRTA